MAIIENREGMTNNVLTFDELEHGVLYVDEDGDLCFLVSTPNVRKLVYFISGVFNLAIASVAKAAKYTKAPDGVSLTITGE